MKSSELLAVATDPHMTPDAVRVTLYYASLGPGEHEYSFDVLSELLEEAGDRRVRKALQRAERCGYLIRKKGGRGTDRFEFSPAQSAGENLSTAQSAGETAVSAAQRAGETCASSPSSTSPPSPTTARVRVNAPPADTDLARLRQFLGEHARAVDLMLESADHPTVWVATVLGKYGPTGTQIKAYGGVPPDRRGAVMATALLEFATNGKVFDNRLFDGYLREAVRNDQRGSEDRGSADKATGAPSRASTGTDGRTWVIEGDE